MGLLVPGHMHKGRGEMGRRTRSFPAHLKRKNPAGDSTTFPVSNHNFISTGSIHAIIQFSELLL